MNLKNFFTLNPKKINVKRVAKAGLLAGLMLYGTFVTEPLWRSHVKPEDQGRLLTYKMVKTLKGSHDNLGVNWSNLNWNHPTWGLEENEYTRARKHLDSVVDFFKYTDNYFKLSSSENFFDKENRDYQRVNECLNNTTRIAFSTLDSCESIDGIIENLNIPRHLAKNNLNLNIVRVSPDFYFNNKNSERFAELRYGDCIFLTSREFDNKTSSDSIYHEMMHNLLNKESPKDLLLILNGIWEEVFKNKLNNRDKVRSELKNFMEKYSLQGFDGSGRKFIDLIHENPQANRDNMKIIKMGESSFLNDINYHDSLPIEMLVEYLSLKCNNNSKSSSTALDYESKERMQQILDRVWGKGWDKMEKVTKSSFKIVDYNYSNAPYFMYRNLKWPVSEMFSGLKRGFSEIKGISRIAYNDYSQKLGWVLEDNPTESALALQLGIVAGVGGLGYSLLRRKEEKTCQDELHFTESYSQEYKQPEKVKATRIDRESHRQFWQGIGRKKEKNYTAGMRERR